MGSMGAKGMRFVVPYAENPTRFANPVRKAAFGSMYVLRLSFLISALAYLYRTLQVQCDDSCSILRAEPYSEIRFRERGLSLPDVSFSLYLFATSISRF